MSDTWRPFTIRRTIGGDVLRPITGWHSALRYGPEDVPFDVVDGTTIAAIPIGYDAMQITIQVPVLATPWQEAVLVRGAFGYPTTPLDGEAVYYYQVTSTDFPLTEQYNIIVRDQPLGADPKLGRQAVQGGQWYYYTLFLCVGATYGQCSWLVGATTEMLLPRNYGHATKMFEMVPDFYQRTDDQQASGAGPLRKFMAILGYEADNDRTYLDGVLNVYDPDFAPLKFVELLGTNLGLPIEFALGGGRYRALVGQLSNLENLRGTVPGLRDFIYAASNYQCDVVRGNNQLLSNDDAEFVQGVGHWQKFTNPLVTTMKNYYSGITAPNNPLTNLTLSPYTGTDTPPLPFVGSGGRGAMAIVGPGTYLDYMIVCGLTPTGITNGVSDALQIGIPVQGNELWEFSFYMTHPTGKVDAQVIATWLSFDTDGTANGAYVDDTSYAPNGYLLDTIPATNAPGYPWVHYKMQHVVATKSDGLTADPSGGVCGYIIPCIWWHSTTTSLDTRYIMGAMLTKIQGVGGAIKPLAPDVFLTLGVLPTPPDTHDLLGSPKSILGPPS